MTRVLFEGRRAVGVAYLRGGVRHEVRVRREVLLSAGSINSPQLLKLSGVGPAAELAEHGIAVVQDLPGVGANLQDHLEFYFQVASREPVTLYAQMSLLRRALIGARWLLRHDGLGASNHFETGGFIRSRAGVRYPDIQFHFLPLAVNYDGSALAREHGFQAHVGPMRSRSHGWVRLRSPDPRDKPRILFNYMSCPEDWIEMRACVRLTREIFAPAGLRALSRPRDPARRRRCRAMPRSTRSCATRSRAPITPRAPAAWAGTADRQAVVDNQARVIGLRGPARGRLLHHALDHDRQSQRPDHHAGREGRRSHPRRAACCRAPAPRTTSPPAGSAASARLAVRRCSAC